MTYARQNLVITVLAFAAVGVGFLTYKPISAKFGQNPREKKVRDDKARVEADGYWVYNDLPRGIEEAKKTGKPIVAILRCIPCEECVKLDDELVNTDPKLRPLLDKYVRVRIVSTNNLDLSIFQFDYDQSFACFLLNADGTIYGRFGTRSHRTQWLGDVSIDGLAKALQGGLDLHAKYPENKTALAGKRGPAPLFPVPEMFPNLTKYGPQLNYVGNVVPSCIHCHQIGDAIKDHYRQRNEPLPDDVLFPYPHPKMLGLILDPKECAAVLKVEPESLAHKGGFQAGDVLQTLEGQPLLSIADVQWVLQQVPGAGGSVTAEVLRDGQAKKLTLTLPQGWRQRDDISWRASTWSLRRATLGGMVLEATEGNLATMSLQVKHVGQYAPHTIARDAGFKVGDIIVSFDGRTEALRETDIIAYVLSAKKSGDKIPVKVMRGGKPVELTLPLQ